MATKKHPKYMTHAEAKKHAKDRREGLSPAYPGEETEPHKVGPRDNQIRKGQNRLLRVQGDWNRAVAAYNKVTGGKRPSNPIKVNLDAPLSGEWIPTGKPFLVDNPHAVRTPKDAEAAKDFLTARLPTNDTGMAVSLTKLTQKQHSPMVIRKITRFGFPIYVALISDCNLDTLDEKVVNYVRANLYRWKSDSLQDKRELAGSLNDYLQDTFENTESVAVIFYIDKAFVSSLHGDFMNHTSCRIELFSLLAMSPHV